MNLELILEPFQYAFMVRAFVGVGLIAVVAAVIGTFVVLKGLAFMGDAIAHTAFTGIALGLLLGIGIHLSALFFALLTALGVVLLTRVSNVRNDTALAILFTGVFALGIVLLSTNPGFVGISTACCWVRCWRCRVGRLLSLAVLPCCCWRFWFCSSRGLFWFPLTQLGQRRRVFRWWPSKACS